MSYAILPKRLLIFMACLAGSGAAPFFGIFALKDATRLGLGLIVLSLWLLALLALLAAVVAWALNIKLGRSAAISACTVGVIALLSYPLVAALAGQGRSISEFTGSLAFGALVALPSVALAIHVASFHARED